MADEDRRDQQPDQDQLEERPVMVDPLIDSYNGEYMEETSAEVASPGVNAEQTNAASEEQSDEPMQGEEPTVNDDSLGMGLGTAAIIISLVSLFFLPVILGAAGIITGFFARQKGASALGWWAIGIGAVSILVSVFFAPFM
ncbi:DUF4190 domain-containing protein [Natribacillus halophilus]|uniref:DUF4190 domain-containing protein n=1 Tax=Natribacillus halophilus TaxID=549003 RepID=A0A1G8JQI1_9BACI|nr:DUF4190 domain-containing protein [Natribacillus halophilus]SDI33277.1 hypothetical protein SAMN04488123_101345 [Natribacillus halophilus]